MAKAKKKAKKANSAKKKVSKKKVTKAAAKSKSAKKKAPRAKLATKKKATKKKVAKKKAAKKKVSKASNGKKAGTKKAATKKTAGKVTSKKKVSTKKAASKKEVEELSPQVSQEEQETQLRSGDEARAPLTKAPRGAKAKELEDEVDDLDADLGDDDLGGDDADYEDEEGDEDEDLEEVSLSAESDDDWDEDSNEVILTDAEGRRYCRVRDCDQISAVEGYCRYHYLLFWKRIQTRKKILKDGKLRHYIEELTSRYSDKHLDMLRKDLKSEKDFLAAIRELEIDESSTDSDYEDEAQSFIAEVRGLQGSEGGGDDDDY